MYAGVLQGRDGWLLHNPGSRATEWCAPHLAILPLRELVLSQARSGSRGSTRAGGTPEAIPLNPPVQPKLLSRTRPHQSLSRSGYGTPLLNRLLDTEQEHT
jgi:hypothetical protein